MKSALLALLRILIISLAKALLLARRVQQLFPLDARPLVFLQVAALLFHRNLNYAVSLLLAIASAYVIDLMAWIRSMYCQYRDLGRDVLDKYPAARYEEIPVEDVHRAACTKLKTRIYRMLITDGEMPDSILSFPVSGWHNVIFFLDDPRKMRGFGRFKVLHEIGHSTESANLMANRLFRGPLIFCSVVIWSLCLVPQLTWSLPATVVLLAGCGWVLRKWNLNSKGMRLEAEIAADSYAVQEMDAAERDISEQALLESPDILTDPKLKEYNRERYETLLRQFATFREDGRLWAVGFTKAPFSIRLQYAILLLAIAALPHDVSSVRLWTAAILLLLLPLLATAYFFAHLLFYVSKLEVEVRERRIAFAFGRDSNDGGILPELKVLRRGLKKKTRETKIRSAEPLRNTRRKPAEEVESLICQGEIDHVGSPLAQASRLLRDRIAASPNDAKLHLDYAKVCEELADLYPSSNAAAARDCLREALKALEMALKKGGQNSEVWNKRGYVLGTIGESIMFEDDDSSKAAAYFAEAVQSHENGLNLQPTDYSAMLNQARAYFSLGKALGRQNDFENAALQLQAALSRLKEADQLLPYSIPLSELRIETMLLMGSVQGSKFNGNGGYALFLMWLNHAKTECLSLLSWNEGNRFAKVTLTGIEGVLGSRNYQEIEAAVASLSGMK
jgi:tetratricopeptide (TPR) repeat protein